MILFTYFDGEIGPVGPAGRTNYTESYVCAELRAQVERDQAGFEAAAALERLPAHHPQVRLMEKLCEAMREAVEQGRLKL